MRNAYSSIAALMGMLFLSCLACAQTASTPFTQDLGAAYYLSIYFLDSGGAPVNGATCYIDISRIGGENLVDHEEMSTSMLGSAGLYFYAWPGTAEGDFMADIYCFKLLEDSTMIAGNVSYPFSRHILPDVGNGTWSVIPSYLSSKYASLRNTFDDGFDLMQSVVETILAVFAGIVVLWAVLFILYIVVWLGIAIIYGFSGRGGAVEKFHRFLQVMTFPLYFSWKVVEIMWDILLAILQFQFQVLIWILSIFGIGK